MATMASQNWQILLMIVIAFAVAGIALYLYQNHCGAECRLAEYKKGLEAANAQGAKSEVGIVIQQKPATGTYERDIRVVRDPLYPPVNRTDSANYLAIKEAVEARAMYVPTRDTRGSDSYRMVGYLTSAGTGTDGTVVADDAGGNRWKVFARQTDRNGRADFYIMPTNNNYDVKVPLNDDTLSNGYRVKNIDDIPQEIRFKTPLMNDGPYVFTELPKSDLTYDAELY